MASIFSRIVAGEIPAYKVAEDENHLAFLDIQPLVKGHVLVIPKKETDYIMDIPDAEYQSLFLFAKKVALGLKKAIRCKRIGVSVIVGSTACAYSSRAAPAHGRYKFLWRPDASQQ
jgi:histidine triad (HIT) family protein